MARLDAAYRPVATRPIDITKAGWHENLGATIEAELAGLGLEQQAAAVLRAVIDLYAGGDETIREAVRRLFARYTSFRWAAYLPREWHADAEFRDRLILLAAHDQGADPRDEILTLQGLCDHARANGIEVESIVEAVAEMASDVDKYGMGSMRGIMLRYGRRRA